MNYAWICQCCGRQFNELPLDYACDAPDHFFDLPQAERETRAKRDSDVCIIDGKDIFVRGCLEIPIVGQDEKFIWGVWISVSKPSFERIVYLWNGAIPDGEPPIFGWLCNNLAHFPPTLGLKTHLHLRSGGIRPAVELEPTDHPLAVEQRQGMTLRRIEEFASSLLRH